MRGEIDDHVSPDTMPPIGMHNLKQEELARRWWLRVQWPTQRTM
jgi:hypothetical protein